MPVAHRIDASSAYRHEGADPSGRPQRPRRGSPFTRRLLRTATLALLLAGAIGGCRIAAPPPGDVEPAGVDQRATQRIGGQAPVLPAVPSDRPLPALTAPADLRTQAVTEPLTDDPARVELRLLVVSATAADYGLPVWVSFLERSGTPYEVFVATEEGPLTAAHLVADDGTGRFQAVLLTSNNLAYEASPEVYEEAFSQEDWDLLFAYERTFDVRQAALYTNPGIVGSVPWPEDYGVRTPGWGTGVAVDLRLTGAGAAVFADLRADASVPVRYAWSYPAALEPGSTAVPLLEDAAGQVYGVTSTAPDGRERLALTFAPNPYLLHSELLGRDLLRWVTRGVMLGAQRYHLSADVDDWFITTDLWDVDAEPVAGNDPWDLFWSRVIPDGFALSAADASAFAERQGDLRRAYPTAGDLSFTMAFNGEGATPADRLRCNPKKASLTSMTRCLAATFGWVNHTWSHAYMDFVDFATASDEIDRNDALAAELGFGANYAARSLVTGDISGLGWYAYPDPDGPKVDNGLAYSNEDLLDAAVASGHAFLASNMSTPSHEPDCVGCGIVHPLNAQVLLVPRWPTNVFAPVADPESLTQAYNAVYGPGGILPYFAADLSFAEILDFESDIALHHLLSGAPYPHYFHVANLHAYASGASLLSDWMHAVLAKATAYLRVPILSLRWDELGDTVARRTDFRATDLVGVWDRDAGILMISSDDGGTVVATGARVGIEADTAVYGGDLISWRAVAPGESFVVPLAPAPTPNRTLSVTKSGDGTVASTPAGIDCGLACSASFVDGTVVALSATPASGWSFTGWSGDCSGTTCTVAMNEDRAVTAIFEPPTFALVEVAVVGAGSVRSVPGGINCGNTCGATFATGTLLTLTAKPQARGAFLGWTGGPCDAQGATCTFTVTGDVGVTASFSQRF